MTDPVLTSAELDAFLAREFPQVADIFTVVDVRSMGLTLKLTSDQRHLRPGGTISGPTLFTLADCGVYLALIAMVGPEALAVTTNGTVDFMRKPEADRALIAEVELLKLGRSLVVGDVRMRSEGSLATVARATMTYSRPK